MRCKHFFKWILRDLMLSFYDKDMDIYNKFVKFTSGWIQRLTSDFTLSIASIESKFWFDIALC